MIRYNVLANNTAVAAESIVCAYFAAELTQREALAELRHHRMTAANMHGRLLKYNPRDRWTRAWAILGAIVADHIRLLEACGR